MHHSTVFTQTLTCTQQNRSKKKFPYKLKLEKQLLLYAKRRSTMSTAKAQKARISITCIKNPHLRGKRAEVLLHHQEEWVSKKIQKTN